MKGWPHEHARSPAGAAARRDRRGHGDRGGGASAARRRRRDRCGPADVRAGVRDRVRRCVAGHLERSWIRARRPGLRRRGGGRRLGDRLGLDADHRDLGARVRRRGLPRRDAGPARLARARHRLIVGRRGRRGARGPGVGQHPAELGSHARLGDPRVLRGVAGEPRRGGVGRPGGSGSVVVDPSQRQARDRTRRGRARGRPHGRQHRPAGQLGRAGGPRRRRGAGVDGGPARPPDLLGVGAGRPRHPGRRRPVGADPSQQPGGQPRRRRSRRPPRWRWWVRPRRGVPLPGGDHGRRDHALPPVPGDPLARDLAARCSRRRLRHGAARRRPARRGTTEPGSPSSAVRRRGTARLRRRPGCPRSQGRAEAAGCHARRVRPSRCRPAIPSWPRISARSPGPTRTCATARPPSRTTRSPRWSATGDRWWRR